jgi:hypothetical protein
MIVEKGISEKIAAASGNVRVQVKNSDLHYSYIK